MRRPLGRTTVESVARPCRPVGVEDGMLYAERVTGGGDGFGRARRWQTGEKLEDWPDRRPDATVRRMRPPSFRQSYESALVWFEAGDTWADLRALDPSRRGRGPSDDTPITVTP